MTGVTILIGDCRDVLRTLPSESVHCVVTSPPYWGLRDYGVDGQIGLESNLAEWLSIMVGVFREVRRVLRGDGVAWVQMGDCYCTGTKAPRQASSTVGDRVPSSWSNRNQEIRSGTPLGFKTKDLVGQPWRLAFALQADGWWLRRDVIWSKPNAMPETVYDRPATAHEYLFLLTKSANYFYDAEAVKEQTTGNAHARGNGVNKKIKVSSGWDTADGAHGTIHREGRGKPEYRTRQNPSFSSSVKDIVEMRNCRSVWEIPIDGYEGAHFATFPPALIEPCIKAGCPQGGTVLDPFGGAGTTGLVADRLQRNAILIELNPEYAAMAEQRIRSEAGMMASVRTEVPAPRGEPVAAAQLF